MKQILYIMNINTTPFTTINLETYFAIWQRDGSTSIPDFPRDPVYRCYKSSVKLFITDLVYPVWWTDPQRSHFVNHLASYATPINFLTIVQYPHLWQNIIYQRQNSTRKRSNIQLIVEHCSETNIRVVKDGCKELLSCFITNQDRIIHITEVTGYDWSESILDMGRIKNHALES